MRFVMDNFFVMRWLFVDGRKTNKLYSIGSSKLLTR